MENKITWRIILLLIAISLIALTSFELINFTGEVIKEKEIVKIGAVIPLTGTSADAGKFIQEGSLIALEELNPKSKYKYEMIYEDSNYDSKTAVTAFNKLSNEGDVNYVLTYASSVAAALMPLADEQRVILIDVASQSDFLSKKDDFTFRIGTSVRDEAEFFTPIIKGIIKNEPLNILAVNTDYGQTVIDDYSKELKAINVNLGIVEKFDSKTVDFRSFLTKIKSDKPAYVFVAGNGKISGNLIKQAKELGIDLRLFGSSTSIERGEFVEIVGDIKPSVIYPYAYDKDSESPLVQKYREIYQSKYEKENEITSANTFDAIKMIIYCHEKNQGLEQVRDCLDNLNSFDGASGKITIDANGDIIKPFILKTFRNGEFERMI